MATWQRAWSFNISFTRSDLTYFDENFVNWGLEDAEFCYRLMQFHGYELVEIPTCLPVHINDSGSPPGNPYFTRKAKDMVNFIDNAIYFYSLYKDDAIIQAITIPDYRKSMEEGFELSETILSKRKRTLENLLRQRELFANHARGEEN